MEAGKIVTVLLEKQESYPHMYKCGYSAIVVMEVHQSALVKCIASGEASETTVALSDLRLAPLSLDPSWWVEKHMLIEAHSPEGIDFLERLVLSLEERSGNFAEAAKEAFAEANKSFDDEVIGEALAILSLYWQGAPKLINWWNQTHNKSGKVSLKEKVETFLKRLGRKKKRD